MTEVLKIEGLSAGYGPLRVIHDLDLVIHPGERVGIVGTQRSWKDDAFLRHRRTYRLATRFHPSQWQADRANPEPGAGALYPSDRTPGIGHHAAGRRDLPGTYRGGTSRLRRLHTRSLADPQRTQGTRARHFRASTEAHEDAGRTALWRRAANGLDRSRPHDRRQALPRR